MHDEFIAYHLKVDSRCKGRLEVKGKRYDVNGFGQLRSWLRQAHMGRDSAHRWVAATLEDNAMMMLQTFLSPNKELARFGCIVPRQ